MKNNLPIPIELPFAALFIETFGKKYPVRYICSNPEKANKIMEKDKNVAVLCVDNNDLAYLTDINAVEKPDGSYSGYTEDGNVVSGVKFYCK